MEEGLKVYRKTTRIVAFVIMGIITGSILLSSLIPLIFNIVDVCKSSKAPEGYVETDAVISCIDAYVSDNNVHYNVYVNYTYDGIEYNDIPLNYYDSTMSDGQAIQIYCNEDNPYDIEEKPSDKINMISILSSSFFFVVALGMSIVVVIILTKTAKGKNPDDKRLRKKGQKLVGVIESIQADVRGKYTVNNMRRVFCTYTDTVTNTIYRFVSEPIFDTDAAYLYEGMAVDIYVNGKDYSEYTIDLKLPDRQQYANYSNYGER